MGIPDPVKLDRRGRVLEITLDHPPVNAIGRATSRSLYRAFQTLNNDPEVGFGPGGWAGLAEFWKLNKPIISAVKGNAVGGGFELLLSTDVMVVADDAEFWLPEATIGLLPTGGGMQHLIRRIPYNIAVEFMLTGRRMSAREAHAYGLANHIVPKVDVLDKAREIADRISRSAPLSTQALKEFVRETAHLPIQDAFTRLRSSMDLLPAYAWLVQSDDYKEGSRAFAEKRSPVWKNK